MLLLPTCCQSIWASVVLSVYEECFRMRVSATIFGFAAWSCVAAYGDAVVQKQISKTDNTTLPRMMQQHVATCTHASNTTHAPYAHTNAYTHTLEYERRAHAHAHPHVNPSHAHTHTQAHAHATYADLHSHTHAREREHAIAVIHMASDSPHFK